MNDHETCPVCLKNIIAKDIVSFDDKRNSYQFSKQATPVPNKSKFVIGGFFRADNWQVSSKISRVMSDLRNALDEDGVKVIIFSQWTSMLDIFEHCLRSQAISFCRLDGTMSQKARQNSLSEFSTGAPRVFLISLRAGGVGLNLVSASVVFLVDPWWNPAVEDQAIDRVHRIGQDKPVIVKRFIVVDSVEEKMISLQAKKRKLASDFLNMNCKTNTASKLTLDDLVELII